MNTQGTIHRALAVAAKTVRAASRECHFVASTDAIDSYDEVVDQGSWILDRFLKNPIVLYAHDSRDLPIGTCTRVDVVGGRLECTIKFCTADENPKAEQVWRLVKAGVLRAVSVGFMPGEAKLEMREGREIVVLYKNTLHEISVCPVPANQDALAKMKAHARGAVPSGELRRQTMSSDERTTIARELRSGVAGAELAVMVDEEVAAARAAPSTSAGEASDPELEQAFAGAGVRTSAATRAFADGLFGLDVAADATGADLESLFGVAADPSNEGV
jgi:HK97 family phage prohead protease